MNQKILAIDDSLTLREFILRSLTRQAAGYNIMLAKDGTEGLTLAASEQPDLILLDFILPDMKGDEVCRRLQANPHTAHLPVVLMSSSAADIKRTESEFTNVVKAIAKPFTPDLLCATVAHCLRETAGRISAPATATAVDNLAASAAVARLPNTAASPLESRSTETKIAGDSSHFSIISVLLALEQDQLTGRLQLVLNNESKPLELYVVAGRPVLVTVRDPAAYLRQSGHKLTPPQVQAAGGCGGEQTKTGIPIFMQFAAEKLMPVEQAVALCHRQSLRLFAPVWTTPRVQFNFEPLGSLPAMTAGFQPFSGTMSEWAMESLRLAGDDFRSALAWGEPTGIPAYTRKGYERIQQIPLSDEELTFAGAISPTHSLEKIAALLNTDVDHAQRILHRFLCLEIFDYWPATLLQTA